MPVNGRTIHEAETDGKALHVLPNYLAPFHPLKNGATAGRLPLDAASNGAGIDGGGGGPPSNS